MDMTWGDNEGNWVRPVLLRVLPTCVSVLTGLPCLFPCPTASPSLLKAPVSPLLIMRKPGDSAKGFPLPAPLGWEANEAAVPNLPGERVEFGARSKGRRGGSATGSAL